jgi:hypothetical protein
VALVLLVILSNVAVSRLLPFQNHLNSDFSTAYLRRHLAELAALPPQTVFLGDGLVAGFRLPSSETAVSVLAGQGCACNNLAFKHGSPASYYALALLLRSNAVKPKTVVLEINQEQYNPQYFGYRRLPEPLAELAWPLFGPDDRAALVPPKHGLRQRLDRLAGRLSLVLAMRVDIKQILSGAMDPKPPPMSDDVKRSVYDPALLGPENVSVRYLERTLEVLHGMGTQVLGFSAPANHTVFDTVVNRRAYDINAAYLSQLLRRHRVRLLDLDQTMTAADFEDEVHLNAAGQGRLAALLAPAVDGNRLNASL